jgi:lactoylglutathione lyase
MAKIIHTMIRIVEEARSVEFYAKTFGLSVCDRLEFDGFTLLYLRNAETEHELELTVNHGRQDPYDLGTGYGHLAFSVESLESEHGRFERNGWDPTPVKSLRQNGECVAKFFFVKDPDGYNIEVLERGGRFK